VQRFAVGAPHVVPELPVFSQLFGFGWSLCALTPDGETWCGGLDSPSDDSAGVRLVEGLQNVAEVVGMMHTSNRRCARLASGDVHCWAFEEATEKLELGERVRDFQVGAFARGSAFQVGGLKGARYAGCWLTESGKVLCNGSNYSGQLGIAEQGNWKAAPTSLERVPAAQELGWIEGGSVASSCVLAEDGRVVCWGRDDSGQVGDGPDRDGVMDPTYVVGLESVVDVSSRGFHACAATANGQVFCWGLNNDGQLGDGGEENASAPVEVLDLTNTVEVVVGLFFSCARSATGTVYCWGKNDQGQIGDGTAIKRNRPVAVQGLGRVERLSLADNMACALKADGRVACWGANRGNLFLPRGVTHSLTPVLIDGLEGVAQLSVGGDHACAVGGDGRTTCWGEPFNGFGPALGGSGVDDFEPIAGLPLAEKVCNGVKHSCALLADGRVKCWGSNLTGQCGVEVGDTVTPDGDPIANLAGVTDFTCGDYTTCALLEDGNIQCWGLMPRTTGPENQYVVGLP
jgi:alpha-tubulin suppressor-like RCC1 family protein